MSMSYDVPGAGLMVGAEEMCSCGITPNARVWEHHSTCPQYRPRVDPHSRAPRTAARMAMDRADELAALQLAYRMIFMSIADPTKRAEYRASEIALEALKAWEREHPPLPWPP